MKWKGQTQTSAVVADNLPEQVTQHFILILISVIFILVVMVGSKLSIHVGVVTRWSVISGLHRATHNWKLN